LATFDVLPIGSRLFVVFALHRNIHTLILPPPEGWKTDKVYLVDYVNRKWLANPKFRGLIAVFQGLALLLVCVCLVEVFELPCFILEHFEDW
jgi:hypothetical protein